MKWLAPPRVGTINEEKLLASTERIEADLRNVRKYGFFGALAGAVIGLAISGDRIPHKAERTVHNVLLGASMGALVVGYLSS